MPKKGGTKKGGYGRTGHGKTMKGGKPKSRRGGHKKGAGVKKGGGFGGALRTALLPFLLYSAQKNQQRRTRRGPGRPKTRKNK